MTLVILDENGMEMHRIDPRRLSDGTLIELLKLVEYDRDACQFTIETMKRMQRGILFKHLPVELPAELSAELSAEIDSHADALREAIERTTP